MTSRDFCYWLQGYFELHETGRHPDGMSREQLDCVRKHLALVFKHDIDPSAGPPANQADLNAIHDAPNPHPQIGGHTLGRPDVLYRC